MKADTEELRIAFQIVDQVDNQPGLLSSQFVQLKAGKDFLEMSLTGLCTSQATIPTSGNENWTWYIDRRILQAFLSTAKTKTVTFDVQKDILLCQSGRQKITAANMDTVTGYASWTPPKGSIQLTLTPELRRELVLHSKYAPTTAAADQLSAVYICKGYGILASDSFVVAVCLDTSYQKTTPLPVLLSSLLSSNSVASVLVDKQGAGVQYKQGYLYQPLSDNCISSYPLKKIAHVVATQLSGKPELRVKAKVFLETLTHLKSFIFGTDTDTKITCISGQPGQTLLSLTVTQGKVQTGMAAEYKTDFKIELALAKLLPWVEYINSINGEDFINCSQTVDSCIFSVPGKPRRVLILSKKA
jgi:hypothetical protein